MASKKLTKKTPGNGLKSKSKERAGNEKNAKTAMKSIQKSAKNGGKGLKTQSAIARAARLPAMSKG